MDRALTAASPIAVGVIGVASLYYVAFSYGLGIIILLSGREGAIQVATGAEGVLFVLLYKYIHNDGIFL